MRTRVLLCCLAAIGATLVASGTASAALVSPTGPFTATATNWKLAWPAHGTEKETSISCKTATMKATVGAPEAGVSKITGTEPPTIPGECDIAGYIGSGPFPGRATMTSSVVPFYYPYARPTYFQMAVSRYYFRVKTIQPLGLECALEFNAYLNSTPQPGIAPFTVTELPIKVSVPVYTNRNVECLERYGEVAATLTATFKLDHALTVS